LFKAHPLAFGNIIFKVDDQLNMFAPGRQKGIEINEYDKKQTQY
jgi:hypothetical protein